MGRETLAGHGGENRAVMVYQTESYHYWETQLGRHDLSYGQFGENFTVDGLPDNEVCVGDRYQIGSALFEVTQPRVTCYRVGIRMDEPRMPALLVSQHRPGFYLRVLAEGEVGAKRRPNHQGCGRTRASYNSRSGCAALFATPRPRATGAFPAHSSTQSGLEEFFTSIARSGKFGDRQPWPDGFGRDPLRPGPAFVSLRVAKVERESASVISLSFEAMGWIASAGGPARSVSWF